MAVSAAWRRRALRLFHSLGIEAASIGPRAGVVGLRRRAQVRKLAPGAVLAADRELARQDWFEMETGLASYLAHGHVAALLDLHGINCVLDVGAHRGQFALLLRDAGYRGHVAPFERMPEALAAYEAAGFEITALYPVSRDRRTARVLEFDCVMVRDRSSRRP